MILRNVARRGRVLRCLAAAALVIAATTTGAFMLPGAASASEQFTASRDAPIHPGVALVSAAGQCTANFVFTGAGKTYLGAAAHCTGKGSETETDGCKSQSYPLGSKIKVEGASLPGRLAYNSWITMQDRHERDANLCAYNDFALIEIAPEDVGRVSPTVPHFGGPTGLRTQGLADGEPVYTFGNSDLRQGLTPLSPKNGVNIGDGGDGRTHQVTTVSPGVPGDSGSGFMDSQGRAFGVLSTLSLTPLPGTNGVSDLAKAMTYANQYGNMGHIQLVDGTESFHSGGGGGGPSSASSRGGLGGLLAPSSGTRRGASAKPGLLGGGI